MSDRQNRLFEDVSFSMELPAWVIMDMMLKRTLDVSKYDDAKKAHLIDYVIPMSARICINGTVTV